MRLFRAESDGSLPPLLLSTNLPDHDVSGILIDPSGTRAGFWAARFFTVHQAIFSVPIAGGVAPVQLSHNAPNQGFVGDLDYIGETPGFQITPDGTRVLYLFDPFSTGVSSLNVVPIDGSGPAIRLNPNLSGRDALAFAVDPQSRWVAYMTGFASGFDLHRVPLDQGQPSTPVNTDGLGLVGYDFRFALDGDAILYRYDPPAQRSYNLYGLITGRKAPHSSSSRPTRTVTRAAR
jgi:hypothetical protein